MGTGFVGKRAQTYVGAMQLYPRARMRELDALRVVLDGLRVGPCSRVVELGAGTGFATENALLDYVDAAGVLEAVDVSPALLEGLRPDPRVRVVQGALDALDHPAASVDLVVSLAAFHHVSHKKRVFQEVCRVLKPGGYLVLADVADETPVQRFFDEVVARHSVTGHDFDFLDAPWVEMLARKAGLEHVSSEVRSTPWEFAGEDELYDFVQSLFCMEVDRPWMEARLRDFLRVEQPPGKTWLDWQLGFHVCRRREDP